MFKKNSQGIYQIQELLLPGLVHGFSTKQFGNMSFRYGQKQNVEVIRNNFLEAVGIKNVAQMDLIHGTKVVYAKAPKIYTGVDGLVTDKLGVGLFLLTGDCMPIIFYDPIKKAIGLAHSGYKGTIGKISLLMLGKMVEIFGSDPKNMLVGIGPAIEKCCHVDPSPFLQENLPEWKNYLATEPNNMTRVDLSGFAKSQLIEVGIKPRNIFHPGYCTKDHKDEFFCSQLETAGLEKPGRFATVVQLA